MVFTIEQLIIPVLAATIYAAAGFMQKSQSDQTFDQIKFLSTVLLGLALGVISIFAGWQVTMETIGQQVIAYGGFIVIIERVIKTLLKWQETEVITSG
jgi:hypothetical protein